MPFKAPSTLGQAADLLYPQLPAHFRDVLIDGPAALGVALALLQGFERIFPELASRTDPLNIAFAGATSAELPARVALGRSFTTRVGLPDIRPIFVGPELPCDPEEILQLTKLIDGEVNATDYHPTLLAHFHHREYLTRPDLICMLHPGIEYNLDLWLRDTGLRDFVRAGVPVLVSAYRIGEARADRAMLEAVGYHLTEPVQNPAAPVVPHSTQPEGERFGHYLYSINGIDVDRWHHPDVKKIDAFKAHVANETLGHMGALKLRLRERITTQGTFDERQLEALAFDRLVEDISHSPYHFRRLLAPPESSKHRNDDYAAAYLIASTLDGQRAEIDCFLKEHPEAIHAVDGYGRSPLHVAASYPLPHMVEHLLKAGFDINKLSDAGETPLSCAAIEHCGASVDVLLEAGAKTDVGYQGMPYNLLQHYIATIDDDKHFFDGPRPVR